jgi:hypothetical protein
MGCKFNDSCELLCGINFKAGCEAGLCVRLHGTQRLLEADWNSGCR